MSWKETNDRITQCRRSANPLACLTQLFESTGDGHVAMALGEVCERAGTRDEAGRWYRVAAERYPRPEFKNRAMAAARRLADQGGTASGSPSGGTSSHPPAATNSDELHVVECSWRKIWNVDGSAPRFVPARQAYLGDNMRAWLADPRSRTHRWLVLSARYGFIDPHQPIEDYDVTFSEPSTGPIPSSALKAQVAYQRRWDDGVALRRFTRVVVHGHSAYVSAVREAFAELGATVVAENLSDSAAGPFPAAAQTPLSDGPAFSWSPERARVLGDALAQVPLYAFRRLDEAEPEWPVLADLAQWPDSDLALLLATCLGITDYQLGSGGAAAYWKAAQRELQIARPKVATDAQAFIGRLCLHPVSSRLAEQKQARVAKVVNAWSSHPSLDAPDHLWQWLARRLAQSPEAKTVAMAMKIVDLLNLARTRQYLPLGLDVPLPIDLRVARISLTSGLLMRSGNTGDALRTDMNQVAVSARGVILSGWRAAVGSVRGLSLLRLDSLLWQLAGDLEAADGVGRMERRLLDAGCSVDVARHLVAELSRHQV